MDISCTEAGSSRRVQYVTTLNQAELSSQWKREDLCQLPNHQLSVSLRKKTTVPEVVDQGTKEVVDSRSTKAIGTRV
jgi:hypothetical protein